MRMNLSRLFSVSFLLVSLVHAMDDNVSFDLKTAQVLAYDDPFLVDVHCVSLNDLMGTDAGVQKVKPLFNKFALYVRIDQKFLSAGTIEELQEDYTLLRNANVVLFVVYKKMKQVWQYALLLGANKIFDTERLKDILVHNNDRGEQKDPKGGRKIRSLQSSPHKSPFSTSPLHFSQGNKTNKENRSTKSNTPSPREKSHARSSRADRSPRANRSEDEKSSPEGNAIPEPLSAVKKIIFHKNSFESGAESDDDVATSAISDTGASSSSSTSSEKQASAAQHTVKRVDCSTPEEITHHKWQNPTPEILKFIADYGKGELPV